MAESTKDEGFTINGEVYTVDDLTFREQRELRSVVRDLAEDPAADIDQMAVMDVVPAFVFVVLKREQPDISIEKVLDMKLSDFILEPSTNGDGPRPTKAPGSSGRRK